MKKIKATKSHIRNAKMKWIQASALAMGWITYEATEKNSKRRANIVTNIIAVVHVQD